MKLFAQTSEGIVVEDRASGITAVIGLLPGRPTASAPRIIGIERVKRDGSTASFGLGPFKSEAEGYEAFLDTFLDRFQRYPDGNPSGVNREKVRLLGRVRSILVPRIMTRDQGYLVLSAGWRAVERGEDPAAAINELWKRMRPAAGGDEKGGSLAAPKADAARATFVQRKVLASDGNRQVEAVFGR